MQRKIRQVLTAHDTPLTPTMTVKRVFPGKSLKNIDPFVFLDHFGPAVHTDHEGGFAKGTGAHPHRGFNTFTYLLDGEMEHRDSRGHHGYVGAGGAQWMKAASGILHDERPPQAFLERGGVLHGFQLWINLPKQYKEDAPEYRNLAAGEVPEAAFPDGSAVRVLIGELNGIRSGVPTHSPMAVWHVRLAPEGRVNLSVPAAWNAFVYVPAGAATAGAENTRLQAGQLAFFEQSGDFVQLGNPGQTAWQDVLFCAGAPIGEPIYTSGPFVMADIPGIQRAYDDFYAGKYGTLDD